MEDYRSDHLANLLASKLHRWLPPTGTPELESQVFVMVRRSLGVACLLAGLFGRPLLVLGQSDSPWPDIKNPGIDLGDFPNSAYTLPAGKYQLELAPFSIIGEDEFNQPEFFTQFLFRLGVTDDVELRVLGNGFTAQYGDSETTGFSPIALDSKIHLWDGKREWLLPASSLEVVLTTDWGSRAFSSGYQPSINLNFDLPLTETLNFEWTVGYGEVVASLPARGSRRSPLTMDENINQVSFQWAFEKDLNEDLQVFLTGQTVESVPGQTAGTFLATGGFYRISDRLMYFGLLGWGVTPDAPRIAGQVGLGVALGPAQSN